MVKRKCLIVCVILSYSERLTLQYSLKTLADSSFDIHVIQHRHYPNSRICELITTEKTLYPLR